VREVCACSDFKVKGADFKMKGVGWERERARDRAIERLERTRERMRVEGFS
jgi:hypothetical protein